MNATAAAARNVQPEPAPAEHFDVLIVGAGISGIGSAYHLQKQTPGTSFVILEAQRDFGGTWYTHRYPGIRSDSDLHTFGYRFKPWVGPPIATADEILKYIGEVIADNDLAPHIRYGHAVSSASWCSNDKCWTIDAIRSEDGASIRFTASFLWMCQGYYRQKDGYMPVWPDMDKFEGQFIHSMEWPDGLDTTDKNVVVIGSGATAATLIPNIAGKCRHVTMLQRSPTYFRTGRNAIDIAETLRELQIDESWIHEIVRRKILYEQSGFARMTFDNPEGVKQELLKGVRNVLGEDFDLDTHFTPSYRPWRQRIAFVPDADLFHAIKSGEASVVTDRIERFTATGIQLASGEHLDADLIVAATGFNMNMLGDIAFAIDGEPLDFASTVTYRGMMFTGIPNMAWVFGYFRASWTLRVDLVADFVCRLLTHMKTKQARMVVPTLRDEDRNMPIMPWIDEEDFNPSYLLRAAEALPKRGAKREWQHSQDYWREKDEFAAIDLDDAAFRYS
ncbi:MAG TPA: NAD(P)/FAD-dependent oxidoreductase [Xanthobacteraceae bacterium]|nr:NAD(P)/FAD-dependent oxidoreductase [Xanthobacteraceae bacterium]